MGNVWGSRVDVEEQDGPVCRVCNNPSLVGNVLYSPCRCVGSRRWVHEGCLDGVTTNGLVRYCNICRTQFIFRRQPTRLSLREGAYRAISELFGWIIVLVRLAAVAVLWVLITPLLSSQICRLFFGTSHDDLYSKENAVDSFCIMFLVLLLQTSEVFMKDEVMMILNTNIEMMEPNDVEGDTIAVGDSFLMFWYAIVLKMAIGRRSDFLIHRFWSVCFDGVHTMLVFWVFYYITVYNVTIVHRHIDIPLYVIVYILAGGIIYKRYISLSIEGRKLAFYTLIHFGIPIVTGWLLAMYTFSLNLQAKLATLEKLPIAKIIIYCLIGKIYIFIYSPYMYFLRNALRNPQEIDIPLLVESKVSTIRNMTYIGFGSVSKILIALCLIWTSIFCMLWLPVYISKILLPYYSPQIFLPIIFMYMGRNLTFNCCTALSVHFRNFKLLQIVANIRGFGKFIVVCGWLATIGIICFLLPLFLFENISNPIRINVGEKQLQRIILCLYFFVETIKVIRRNVFTIDTGIYLNDLQGHGQYYFSVMQYIRNMLFINHFIDIFPIGDISLEIYLYSIDRKLLDESIIPFTVITNVFTFKLVLSICVSGGLSVLLRKIRTEIAYYSFNYNPYGAEDQGSSYFIVVSVVALTTHLLTAHVIRPFVINNQTWNMVFMYLNLLAYDFCMYTIRFHCLLTKLTWFFERYFFDKSTTTLRLVNYCPENYRDYE